MSDSTPRQLHPFPGGLSLDSMKAGAMAKPVKDLPTPKEVWVSMHQHCGLAAIPCVKTGQKVRTGELIGRANGTFSANVHASVTGTVGQVCRRPIVHPGGLSEMCVQIISATEQHLDTAFRLSHDYRLADPNLLRQEVAEAGIVGLGGAVFPTALKLAAEADQALHTLVINGAECDPAISCDEMLMREHAPDIVSGIQIMLHILQINTAIIAIEDDKQAAHEAISAALADAADQRLQLCRVPTRYPEGGERQLIQVISGTEVPSGGLPIDIGYLCHNVATAFAINDTFINGHALTSRIITICGNGVAAPRNLRVPMGTGIHHLIDYCGGYVVSNARVIVGGVMMGFTVSHDDVPVDKSTNCILVLPEQESRSNHPVMPCIRCGDCATVCPANLLPQQLYWHTRGERLDDLQRLHVTDCIECGCCDYVCPSNLPLTDFFRYAKDQLWSRDAQLTRAGLARTRYENRELRLDKLHAERQARRQRHRQAVREQSDKQKAIAEAVARARQKKQRMDEDPSS